MLVLFPHRLFIVLILHCYARSTLEHYVRVRAKSRVLGGSLGRSFSRSCAGLVGPPPPVPHREQINADSRRASLRVSKKFFNNSVPIIIVHGSTPACIGFNTYFVNVICNIK